MCWQSLPLQRQRIGRTAEIRYLIARSECHKGHNMIVTKHAFCQPWLVETSVTVDAPDRFGAEQECTTERMLTINVTVITGKPYVMPKSGSKLRMT